MSEWILIIVLFSNGGITSIDGFDSKASCESFGSQITIPGVWGSHNGPLEVKCYKRIEGNE